MNSFDFSKKIFCHPQHVADIKAGKRPYPITVELDLTDRCNHKCSFCYTPKADKYALRTLKSGSVVALLKELSVLGVKAISYTGGGEPTLHPDFSSFVRLGCDLGLSQGLVTNGSTLRPELARSGLEWIRVSIGGGTPGSYLAVQGVDHFDLVIRNLERLLEHREGSSPYVGLRMLLNSDNVESLPNLAKVIRSMQARPDYVQLASDQFSKIDSLQSHSKEIEDFENLLPDGVKLLRSGYIIDQDVDYPSKCYAHLCQVAIKASGEVIFCKNVRAHDGFVLGSIYEKSFVEIWNSDKARELEKRLRPSTCGVFCKNSCLNDTLEMVCNPSNDVQVNFIN